MGRFPISIGTRECIERLGIAGLVAAIISFGAIGVATAATTDRVGSGHTWPSTWQAVPGLNDPHDIGVVEKMDFVGDSSDPGFYTYYDGSYLNFRIRVDEGGAVTWGDAIWIMIDRDQNGTPDYALAWDTGGGAVANHGLELQIAGTNGATWATTNFNDIDGNNGSKGAIDINGSSRTTDGYVRTVDSQSTTNFSTTTFIDIAVSCSYLLTSSTTPLRCGQTWNIQIGSRETGNDHSVISTDVGGSASPSTTPLPWGATIKTLIRLDSFGAAASGEGVDLRWVTGYEVDNLGFNVHREAGGRMTQLNAGPIAGSALLAGPGVELGAGQSYSWRDDAPLPGARYWLEEMDLAGASAWHGPVAAVDVPGASGFAPPDRRSSPLLADLAHPGASAGGRVEARAKIPQLTPGAAALAAINAAPVVKMLVRQEGWYRIGRDELVAAGLVPRVDPRYLQLFVDGAELPMIVRGGGDGSFDSGDAVEFAGIGLDSPVTDARAYWLKVGTRRGRRVQTVQSRQWRPFRRSSFPATVERKDRTVYFSSLRNGDAENFFGAVVRNPVELILPLPHPEFASGGGVTVDIAVQGVTLAPHRVRVSLNGVELGEVSCEGMARGAASFRAPIEALAGAAEAVVGLEPLGGSSDTSLVDTVRVTYPHRFVADDDLLKFTLPALTRGVLTGFTTGSVRVVDITDRSHPIEVAARVERRADGYAVLFNAPGSGTRTLLAFAPGKVLAPAAIHARRPSSWRRPGRGADLVIIAHRELLGAVEPLREFRAAQGLRVAAVDVEDLYDEFSFGHKSPRALRDFLAYAAASWKLAPRYVVLVGDASFDPKDYQGGGNADLVPTRLVDTQTMETASDGWFADFSGSGLPAMAIGRLPARTTAQLDHMIARILEYERSPREGGVLLVSGGNGGYDFSAASDVLRASVPADVAVDSATSRDEILRHLDGGERLVNYQGHGSTNLWAGGLLSATDALALANGRLPVFLSMTCLNNYFVGYGQSLAEALLNAPGGGAVAVYGSSGMTDAAAEDALDQELFRWIFDPAALPRPATLGDATLAAMDGIADLDVRRTYQLLGDPSMRLP